MLVAVDEFIEVASDESPTGLIVPSDAPKKLNVSSSVPNQAYDKQIDAFRALCSFIVETSGHFFLGDKKKILLAELLQAVQLLAVHLCDFLLGKLARLDSKD